jgi:hypothetical protein
MREGGLKDESHCLERPNSSTGRNLRPVQASIAAAPKRRIGFIE